MHDISNKSFTNENKKDTVEVSHKVGDGRWQDSSYPKKTNLKAIMGTGIILAFSKLVRIEFPNFRVFKLAKEQNKPILIVAWHSAIPIALYVYRKQGITIMTSLSRDGDVTSKIHLNLGYKNIRGSSSRGGIGALLKMIKALKNGDPCTITVDGPKGPLKEVKPGAVFLAQKTGALLLPLGMAYSNYVCTNSWDKTKIPLPGSRVVAFTGETFTVDPELSVEAGCEKIKTRILESENAAHEYLLSRRLPKSKKVIGDTN